MRARSAVMGCFLLVAGHAWAAPAPAPESPRAVAIPEVGRSVPTGAPIRVLEVGDPAPLFSFPGADGRWRPFAGLTERGPVLLVFGARSTDLESLARWRHAFEELGVTTALAVQSGTRTTREEVRRLGLDAVVIGDPGCAIASLYNSLDPLTHRHAAAFFVVGSDRQLRAMRHGPLPHALQILGASARGLGLPLPESALSLSGWASADDPRAAMVR